MTIGQLRERLANYPDDMPVICDMHSEYASVDEVDVIRVFENRGYYSKVYNNVDDVKAFAAVNIGTTGGLDTNPKSRPRI
jgi:hypothetical protein